MKKKTDKTESSLKNNTTENEKQDKIPRNVNYYRHLLDANYINENDINWVLKLRDGKKYNVQKLNDAPFKVYDQFTESIVKNNKKVTSDLVNNNATNVEHLTRHRIGTQKAIGVVNFEISLRPNSQDQNLRTKERSFSTIPFKDKGEHPIKYLKLKDELQKMRECTSKGQKFQYQSNLQNLKYKK